MIETREGLHENFGDPEETGHDQSIPDTSPPPPPDHGWLEQFEHLTFSSFENLKATVEAGLQSAERMALIKVAMKLFALAFHNVKEEDFTPEMKTELEAFILELESIHNLPFSSTSL